MYLAAFVKRLKALDEQQRRDLLADPWDFKTWLAGDDGGEHDAPHPAAPVVPPCDHESVHAANLSPPRVKPRSSTL